MFQPPSITHWYDGMWLRTSARIIITTCSEPIPAVTASLSLGAFAIRSAFSGPEGVRDHDLGLRKLAIQHRVGPLLVGGDDQIVPASLDELAQRELARHAAQQLPRREVDVLRRRCVLAAVILLLDRGRSRAHRTADTR